MSTARLTLGNILGAISTTANTVTSTLGAVNAGVDMINRSVDQAAKKQQLEQKLDLYLHQQTLVQEKAKELAESRVKVEDWMSKSNSHSEKFQLAYTELSALLPSK